MAPDCIAFIRVHGHGLNESHITPYTDIEFEMRIELKKDTPYLTLADELWGVCHNYLGEN